MNKSDVIEEFARRHNLPRKSAELLVQSLFQEMKDALGAKQRVEFRGFGTFTVREYDGYVGRNPKTGEETIVPSKRRVRFRMSEVLFSEMNQQFEEPSERN